MDPLTRLAVLRSNIQRLLGNAASTRDKSIEVQLIRAISSLALRTNLRKLLRNSKVVHADEENMGE